MHTCMQATYTWYRVSTVHSVKKKKKPARHVCKAKTCIIRELKLLRF